MEISSNKRNKIYLNKCIIKKYYANKKEYQRELSALKLLENSNVNFIFPKIKNHCDKINDLWIETEFIENFNKRILFESFYFNKKNLKDFAKIFIQLHSLNSKNKSAELKGMVDKAIKEGKCLPKRYLFLLKYVKDNYNHILFRVQSIKDKCFIHGDVFWENIICNKNNKFIGFWDYGHSGMGIAEADFRQLPFLLGSSFFDFLKFYESLSKRKIDKEILIYLSICRFLELVYHYKVRLNEFNILEKIENNFYDFINNLEENIDLKYL